jgi:nitrite reductase/ring-hydroxylating ferredoxin subunit
MQSRYGGDSESSPTPRSPVPDSGPDPGSRIPDPELSIIIGAVPSHAKSLPVRHLVAPSAAIPENGRLVVDVGDATVGIFRVGGRLFAYENSCPHMGGPVCQGLVIPAVRELLDERQASRGYAFDESEMRIVCPWHGYEFAIETGAHPAKPSIRLTPVPVDEQDGQIYVEV